MRKHLLIIGAPRSGTTLLAAMVSKHTEITILFEDFNFAAKKILSKKIVGNKLCIPHQIEINNKRKKLKSMVINLLTRINMLHNILEKEKYPLSFFSIEDYLELENSKIIAILRRGNDVIESIMKRGGKKYEIALHRWLRAIEIIHELYSKYPDRVLLIRFENLVQKPEKTLQKTCRFIGVEYQKQMLEGYKFTPVYHDAVGIDPRKANGYRNSNINHNLKHNYPRIFNKYQELVNRI